MSSWFSDQNGFFNHGSGDLFVNKSSICSNDEKVEFQNEQSYPDGSRGAGGSSGGIDSHSSGGYGSIERYGCGGGFANSSTGGGYGGYGESSRGGSGGGCLSYGESGYVARNFAQEGTGGGYADSSCGKGTPRIPKAINPRAVTGR